MSTRTAVTATGAPGAIGPYSQAIRAGELLFLSGQIPLEPVSGEVVDGDIRAQTRRVLDNIAAVLDAAGASMDAVVKTTVYLVDLSEFGAMNEIYATAFDDPAPARSTVQVSRLPRDVRVEIDAIARIPLSAIGGRPHRPAPPGPAGEISDSLND